MLKVCDVRGAKEMNLSFDRSNLLWRCLCTDFRPCSATSLESNCELGCDLTLGVICFLDICCVMHA